MRHNEKNEELPPAEVTYMEQDMYKPARITQVYYGSALADNWTYLGHFEDTGSYAKPTFAAFDEQGNALFSKTKDWEKVNRHFQIKARELQEKEREKEVQLKSIRRKQRHSRRKEIER